MKKSLNLISENRLVGWRKLLSRVCPIPQRHVFAIMGFLGVVNAYTMRTCLSLAITEMVYRQPKIINGTFVDDPDACPSDPEELKPSGSAGTFEWDEETQGLILSSFFWGYVITHLPGGLLAEKFGGKYSLGLGILCTAVFTLLTPVAADYGGAGWVIVVRICEGLGEGPTFPAVSALLAQWAPPAERSRMGSLVYAGVQIGTVIGTALSGLLLNYTSWGWPSVFYLFGILGVLWFIFWVILCYNNPSSHPFISEKERKFLEDNIKGTSNSQNTRPTPWRAILTSVPLWGLVIAQVGHDWGFFTLATDLPKYMKDVMKFNIGQNTYLSSLPYLIMWFVSMSSSWVADWMITRNILSTTNTRKIYTTIASVGPAIGIMAASYAGCDRVAVAILFTVGMALMGCFYPGMRVNTLDLSPNYAGTLMALVNGIGAFAGIVAPYIVGVLTPDSTLVQWRTVFWITLGVLIITNFAFVLTASGDIQPWNDISEEERNDNKESQPQSNSNDNKTERTSQL